MVQHQMVKHKEQTIPTLGSGETVDNTKSPTNLPKTGKGILIFVIGVIAVFGAIRLYQFKKNDF